MLRKDYRGVRERQESEKVIAVIQGRGNGDLDKWGGGGWAQNDGKCWREQAEFAEGLTAGKIEKEFRDDWDLGPEQWKDTNLLLTKTGNVA